ncbi:MAG: OsmC family peroxiredoxin [Nitrospirae bacterium]|nr:MAG: OsmC family peroxiredoxin [Nitrospirota bacterium]
MEKKRRELKEIVATRIELFKKKPEAAVYRPKVSSRHVSALYTETKVREHTVKSDYAEAAGGTDLAPNPIELLLAAFGACVEAAFYEFAEHEGLSVKGLSVDVEGTLDLRGLFMVDDTVPPGFQDLKYVFTIETGDNEAEIIELAKKVIAHCPVVDSLVRPVKISGDIKVLASKK